MRNLSPLNAAPAELPRLEFESRGALCTIDFSAPPPAESLPGHCSGGDCDLELGVFRSTQLPPHRAFMPPSVALMLLEPDGGTAAVPSTLSAEPIRPSSNRQAACLIFLGVLAGASVGVGIYFGAIRPHQH